MTANPITPMSDCISKTSVSIVQVQNSSRTTPEKHRAEHGFGFIGVQNSVLGHF
jgi:hypothetical protein